MHIFAKDVVSIIKKEERKIQEVSLFKTQLNPGGKSNTGGLPQAKWVDLQKNSRVQLVVDENDELVAHSLPKRSKIPKHPHSLADAIAKNRSGEKKH